MKKILLFVALIGAMCANAQIQKLDLAAEGLLQPTEVPGLFYFYESNATSIVSEVPDSMAFPLYTLENNGIKFYKDIVVFPRVSGIYYYCSMITRDIFTTDGKIAIMMEDYDYKGSEERNLWIVDEEQNVIFNSPKIDNEYFYESELYQKDGKWYLALIYEYYNEGDEHIYQNRHYRTIFYLLPGTGELYRPYDGPGK